MNEFVHLHLHTQYSLLDGLNKIPNVLELARDLGQPALAMTDHGNLHGAIQFYEAAKKAEIKPIIGCELYVTPTSRFERKPENQGGGGNFHLTVLAKDLTGYHNLCKLVTLAHQEGFYFKPRVDHELLERFSEGLIVLSGCLGSELGGLIQKGDEKQARKLAEFYANTFKDRYYFEVQPHQISEQQQLNEACTEFARTMGIPIVASTDCHYSGKDDHFAQEVLMCISTAKNITDPSRIRHEGVQLHLKSYDEMRQEFGSWSGAEEALRNTVEIAKQCDIEFDFSEYFMPHFEPEDKSDVRSLTEFMSEYAFDGLEKRFEEHIKRGEEVSEEDRVLYKKRLEEEITIIDRMGFPGYFLVVADFIVWAKENGVPVGPGRGSGAGSLVAYAMRITEVDPIRHKLLFERFLNPDRVSLPDFDVDFCVHGRDSVIRYVVEKYGKEKVAQIATFGTLKAKAAIKDVGRVLGKGYAEMDRVAQLVPAPRQGFDFSLQEALKMEPKLAEYAKRDGEELISLALKIEGLNRHSSTHAAGVVIGDRPLIELLPLMVDKDGNDVTQFSMKYVEKIGLVKFDFLGLKTLTVIRTALDIIQESRGKEPDLQIVSLDDPETYKMLCGGNTIGVFQLESGGIAEMTVRLKPTCFEDLVAILALYRPGPLDAGMVDHYIARKHGREPVTYPHPLMEGTLSDTYGIILYQEQIMQLARELAGYSLAEADLLRRAMGKKIPEEMAVQRSRFVDGAKEKNISEKLANEIFDQMETFARYGFNRSHSAAYAMISFQTAYLKTHYHVEFMAALMSHEMGDTDKVLKNFNECRKHNIEVRPPDVNRSQSSFSAREGHIRYGLSAVKGVGEKAVEEICKVREKDGPYKDLEDFVERVDLRTVNKRVLESLVKCGAFDFSGLSRRELFDRLEEVIRIGQAMQRAGATDQMDLFGAGSGATREIHRRNTSAPEWPVNQKLAFEREAIGFYISGHPLQKHRRSLSTMGTVSISQIKNRQGKSQVKMGGVVTALQLKNTKKGDRYATFTLEDWEGTIDAIVWPDVYLKISHLLIADEPILVTAKADISDERSHVIIDSMESLIELRDRNARRGVLVLDASRDGSIEYEVLKQIFGKHEGTCPVEVRFRCGDDIALVALRSDQERQICIRPSEELCDEVEQFVGRPVLSFI